MAETFALSGRNDPRNGVDGKVLKLLQQQVKAYSKEDPATKRQQCLPVEIIRRLAHRETNSKFLQAYQQNLLFSFFFAMQASKYLKATGPERQTITLRMRNIMFYKDNKIVKNSEQIKDAEKVAVMFKNQKNDTKEDIRHAQCTNNKQLCPVCAVANIVNRLKNINAKETNFIYLYGNNHNTKQQITSSLGLQALWEFVTNMPDKEELGLDKTQIGNRLLRSLTAMAMVLTGSNKHEIKIYGQ